MALADGFVVADPKRHELKKFRCGKPVMDQFLARFAVKNRQLGLSSTWVLPLVDDNAAEAKLPVAAYYTLASATVRREDIPQNKALPAYPVPVVLLARLAIAQKYQGQHLGEKTLVVALRKAVALTQAGLPALGLVLDVLDDNALGFYQHFEIFEPFTHNPMRLFAPMSLIQQI